MFELAPLWMLMVVGGMDQKVDRKELKTFAQQVAIGPSHSQSFGKEVFFSIQGNISSVLVAGNVCSPLDGLKRVAELLERLEPAQAADFKASLLLIGKRIAESSGGLFRKKVSKEEMAALAVAAVILRGVRV